MDSLLNVANSFQTIFFSKFAQQYNPYLCSRRNKQKKKRKKRDEKKGRERMNKNSWSFAIY